jgi:DinB superfamily
MIDFAPVRSKRLTLGELAATLTRDDLARSTEEMCDLQLALIADAVDEDVVLVPKDPDANDTFASDPSEVGLAWTLGHVVVHTTASSEEAAGLALILARGLPLEPGQRLRHEVPWEEATTADFIRHRIQESRRMRLHMLDAWPDEPHLDNTYEMRSGGTPMNAVARFLSGLSHDDSHLGQIRNIMVQARAARGSTSGRG